MLNLQEQFKKSDYEQDGVDIEVYSLLVISNQDGIRYAMQYDENQFLNQTIKDLNSHIDEMYTKYDPSKRVLVHRCRSCSD